jgi:ankyrin repeat protein
MEPRLHAGMPAFQHVSFFKPDRQREPSATDIYDCIDRGDLRAVERLLQHGACDLREVRNGQTPFMRAIERFQFPIARAMCLHDLAIVENPEGKQSIGILVKHFADQCLSDRAVMENGIAEQVRLLPGHLDRLKVLGKLIRGIEENETLRPHFSLHAEIFRTARRMAIEETRCDSLLPFGRRLPDDNANLLAFLERGDAAALSNFQKYSALALALEANCAPVVDSLLNSRYTRRFQQAIDTSAVKWNGSRGPSLSSGLNLLFYAACECNGKSVQAVLAHGYDVDSLEDANGSTPLMCAVASRNIDAAEALLRQGARIDADSQDGRWMNALDIALDADADEAQGASSNSREMIKLLLPAAGPMLAEAFQERDFKRIVKVGDAWIEMADCPEEFAAAIGKCKNLQHKALAIAAILAALPAHVGVEPEKLDARLKTILKTFDSLGQPKGDAGRIKSLLGFAGQSGKDPATLRKAIMTAYFPLQNQLHDGMAHGGAYPIFTGVNDRPDGGLDHTAIQRSGVLQPVLSALGFNAH